MLCIVLVFSRVFSSFFSYSNRRREVLNMGWALAAVIGGFSLLTT